MLPYVGTSPSFTTVYPDGHFRSMAFNASFRCGDPIGPPRSSLNKYVTTPPVSVSRVSVTASEQPASPEASRTPMTQGLILQRKTITGHDLLSGLAFHKFEK